VSTPRDFDVLIAGAGMVGAALAALLATGPRTRLLRVALVEPQPAQSPASAEALDLRVSALSCCAASAPGRGLATASRVPTSG
jgi:2-polyprenyl-6-methoxyphenol hydroxylase-like FAD-dependent oxidoreductase